MGILHPVYTEDDLKAMPDKEKRRQLSAEIFRLLQNDLEVRALLRRKTQYIYDQLKNKT